MPRNDACKRHLSQFRAILKARGIDYWLQPVNDEFQGEYVPAYAERLPWLSGFHGSAGVGIVTADASLRSALLVDGRYTVQAAQDVDPALWHVVNSGEVSIGEWLSAYGHKGGNVGCDAWLHSYTQLGRLSASLDERGFRLTPQLGNPVDEAWPDRPAAPQGEVELYPNVLAGQSLQEKVLAVSRRLDEVGADALIVTQPDEAAWLLNIRGSDIPFNPLLLSYAVVLRDGRVVLITHPRGFAPAVQEYFRVNRVECLTFDGWFRDDAVLARFGLEGARLGIDAGQAAYAWWLWASSRPVALELIGMESPIQRMKAVKYTSEQEGMREAHRRDGVALAHFLSGLEQRLPHSISELQVVDALEEARSADNSYRGASFATIAGSGPNGAIVHYRASEESDRVIEAGEVLLLDSGGQYFEGTTDITRMIPYQVTSAEIRDRYTRVLKGHIALARAVFPIGTSGRQLDVLARQYLWEAGCDYDHGTGHGVGTYLCVHEGPQRISKKGSDVPLEPGMVVSNEPGYYKEGAYGIRIENLIMVRAGDIAGSLQFETITLVPIDTSLIEAGLLLAHERDWLNAYHARVLEVIGPRVRAQDARDWLVRACAAI